MTEALGKPSAYVQLVFEQIKKDVIETQKQLNDMKKELLSNPEVKSILREFAMSLNPWGDVDEDKLNAFIKIYTKPEWEIIAFKAAGASYVYNKQNNGRFICIGTNTTIDEEDFDPSAIIYSVKRLSDGEVFSVGDMVEGVGGRAHKIEKLFLFGDGLNINCGSFGATIDGLIKAKTKQPLFTTEDGKEIYEGDSVFYVSTDKYISLGVQRSSKLVIGSKESFNRKNQLTFFSSSAAEEYVLMNKPMLSANEVIAKIDSMKSAWITKDLITELVKSKI